MAKAPAPETVTPSGRNIVASTEKPKHLVAGGPGRSRKPTEFDDMVPGWYESGEWFKIPAEGDTDTEKLSDLEEVYKAVQRAVAFHELGVTRLKEDNPEDDEFSGYGVWVQVRDRQKRTRKPKDENGNVIEDESSDDDNE